MSSESTNEPLKDSVIVNSSLESVTKNSEEHVYYSSEGEADEREPYKKERKRYISVNDSLPYGIRLYYETPDNLVRLKNIGVKKRILVLGVIGSFTPYCWNRHLFRVLKRCRYYEERGIDYICCISTNDAFTHKAWGRYLGCDDSILMFADTTNKFTRAIGMDIILPWLDNKIRSRRYILYVEDMVVSKMIVAPDDEPNLKWNCEHLIQEESIDDDFDSDLWI